MQVLCLLMSQSRLSSPSSLPIHTLDNDWHVHVRSLLSDSTSPMALFSSLNPKNDQGVGFLLESTDGDTRLARFSMLGINPDCTISFNAGVATIVDTLTGETD
jgi:anthranilate/para-aminobenzoate synthase component I